MRLTYTMIMMAGLACQVLCGQGLDDILDELAPEPKGKTAGVSRPAPTSKKLLTVMAEPELKSDITAPLDAYEESSVAVSSASFASFTNLPWWKEQAEFRLPVMVSESVGLPRDRANVGIKWRFPAGTLPEAIRAVTPEGLELPTQAHLENPANNTIAVTFLVSIGAREQKPVFVYFGKQALPPPDWVVPDTCCSVRETASSLWLCNNRMAVELNRVAGVDDNSVFRSLRCHGAAQNQINPVGTRQAMIPAGARAQVIESGPVMTRIRYESAEDVLTLTLYAAKPFLDYSHSRQNGFKMFWLPGGDTVNDLLYCASPEGLKSKPINYTGGNTPPTVYKIMPWLQEGWLAIQDTARHETVGNFFDLKQLNSITLQLLYFGYWLYGSSTEPLHGALYCAQEFDPLACRRAYAEWMYPLRSAVGIFQAANRSLPVAPKAPSPPAPQAQTEAPEQAAPPDNLIRVTDPYRADARAPNPMYFATLTNAPWWDDRSEYRLPVLVTEPIGLNRDNAIVSLFHSFPAGTAPDSIRVVHPYGAELQAQARVADSAQNLIEVTFALPLQAGGHVPVFVYYGKTAPPPAELPAADPCLATRETPGTFVLCNNRLAVELNKVTGAGAKSIFRSLQCHAAVGNQIEASQQEDIAGPNIRAQIIENGPVRKTIRYDNGAAQLTLSLAADTPLLYIVRSGIPRQSLCWRPGGDSRNDTVYYETPEGIKAEPATNSGPLALQAALSGLKEGWIAAQDRSGHETLGTFFELTGMQAALEILPSGIRIGLSSDAVQQGALYCSRDADIKNCRAAYIAWKNPPRIIVGAPQAAFRAVPRVPVLGKDFIRMHLLTPKHHLREGAASASNWVATTRAFGGNYMMNWGNLECLYPATNFNGEVFPPFLDELVRVAHAAGMGVSGGSVHLNPRMAKAVAQRGVDALWLADEWGWSPSSRYNPLNENQRRLWLAGKWDWSFTNLTETDRADFQKRYGVAMPEIPKSDLSALTQAMADGEGTLLKAPSSPELFTELALTNLKGPVRIAVMRWMMDANNRLYADLADAARAGNSNILATMTTSPNNLTLSSKNELRAVHDLESLAGSLTTIAMDLYDNNIHYLNMMIKHERGAMGNRRPALIISGYVGWDNAYWVELNQYLQVLFGANSLAYFIIDRPCNYRSALGAKSAFEFIAYTGLGNFAARAHTLEFAGILWNRDEIFDSLQSETGNYDYLLRQYLSATIALPVNFIYGKYLQPEHIAPYKVIIVPRGAALNETQAAALTQYVETGGNLILEGEALRNAAIARLAGATRNGDAKQEAGMVTGALAPLSGWSADMKVPYVPMKPDAGTEVLATLGQGIPAVTRRAAGKGHVVCSAMLLGNKAASEAGNQLLCRLIEDLAGYRPVTVEPLSAAVVTTVLTDGTDYMIGVYNMSIRPYQDLALGLRGFPEQYDALLSLRQGTVTPLKQGKATGLNLAAYEVDFYRLVSSKSRCVPVTTETTMPAIQQAARRGMTFLKLAPLPSKELLARRALKQGDTIYVGLFNMKPRKGYEGGAEAMMAELAKWPKVKAELINDLQPDTIGFYDVIIVPNKTRPRKYTARSMRNWENNIRHYVEQGGGVLLLHHAVGYGEASDANALFQEIGSGTEVVPGKQFTVAAEHPLTTASALHDRFRHDLKNPAFAQQYQETVMATGDLLESGFLNHVIIQTGKAGTEVLVNASQQAVVSAGAFGKGKVVLSGMNIGCHEFQSSRRTDYREELTTGERNLLINSVYWLGN